MRKKKQLIMLILLMMMGLVGNSQSTLNQRVNIITKNNEKFVLFKYDDAKIILTDLISKNKTDSLMVLFKDKIKIKDSVITKQKFLIKELEVKNELNISLVKNREERIQNLYKQKEFYNKEILLKDGEIKKQRRLKFLGFTLAVAIPIAGIILL